MLAKISALALLTRIFTLLDRFLRWGSYFLWTYIMLVWVASMLIVSLECRPFSTRWGVPHRCPIHSEEGLALNINNALVDLCLIILPQPSIWKLKMNFGRRLGLSLIFAIGLTYVHMHSTNNRWVILSGFRAFAVAVVRIVNVHIYQSSLDPSC